MKAGFSYVDITPRVGVELAGFGPYLHRYSIAVRDRLYARAAAFEVNGKKAVIISCDLLSLKKQVTEVAKSEINKRFPELNCCDILIHTIHTHSGPSSADYSGWGAKDDPYMEILPYKIAKAGIQAVEALQEATVKIATVPCEGIGLNREYDRDAPPLDEVLDENWRPAKPELTDTKTTVIQFQDTKGAMLGFMAYFGCHPVVCCETTRYIHGDYAGVAMNNFMREMPGTVALFLQGAQGDVNSCVVHKPEPEAMLALDIIAARFSRAVRLGLQKGEPIEVNSLKTAVKNVRFTVRKTFTMEALLQMDEEQNKILHNPEADDADKAVRMAMVKKKGIHNLINILKDDSCSSLDTYVQGIKLGPIAFLGCPFETMQAIKNDVVRGASSPIPLVMGLCNDTQGYAPDKNCANRGGYAADIVPLIVGKFPLANVHEELANALIELDKQLQ